MVEGAKIFSEPSEKSSFIAPHPSVKTNNLLRENKEILKSQLDFLREEAEETRASTSRAIRMAILANIIAIIAIAIAIQDQIVKLFMWLFP